MVPKAKSTTSKRSRIWGQVPGNRTFPINSAVATVTVNAHQSLFTDSSRSLVSERLLLCGGMVSQRPPELGSPARMRREKSGA